MNQEQKDISGIEPHRLPPKPHTFIVVLSTILIIALPAASLVFLGSYSYKYCFVTFILHSLLRALVAFLVLLTCIFLILETREWLSILPLVLILLTCLTFLPLTYDLLPILPINLIEKLPILFWIYSPLFFLLASLLTLSLIVRKRADRDVKQPGEQIARKLEAYFEQHNRYPAGLEELNVEEQLAKIRQVSFIRYSSGVNSFQIVIGDPLSLDQYIYDSNTKQWILN